MYFVDKGSDKVNNRSTVIQKTISTIRGDMELTKICLSLGVKSVSLRQMNQDGLENFFGSVRSVCHTSSSTIPSLFRPGYTNLILSNLVSKHSIASNCEEDDNTSLLTDVYELYDDTTTSEDNEPKKRSADDDTNISEDKEPKNRSADDEPEIDLEVNIDELPKLTVIDDNALILESGTACKTVTSSTKCELCKFTLEAYCPLDTHLIITANDSAIPQLTYPTLLFMSRFKLLFQTVVTILPFICHEKNLLKKLISSLNNIDLEGIGCKEHKLEIAFKMKKTACKDGIMNFMKEINGILSRKIIEPLPNQSVIHEKAFDIVKKKKGIGKNGQKMLT